MEHAKEHTEQVKKKPYEAPAVRKVRLNMTTSVLNVCVTSVGSSPSVGTCTWIDSGCFTPTY